MKTLLIFLCLFLASCESDYRPWYESPHKLRQLYTRESLKGSVGGNFLSFSGSTHGSGVASLFWQGKNGEWLSSHIDMNKMRVVLDETAEPYVTFTLNDRSDNTRTGADCNGKEFNPQWIVSEYPLDYFTIHCKAEDFPYYIQLDPRPKDR